MDMLKLQFFLCSLLISLQVNANNSIKKIELLSSSSQEGQLVLELNGTIKDFPDLTVENNKVFVFLPHTVNNSLTTINKKLGSSEDQSTLVSNKWNGGTRLELKFPFDLSKHAEKASISLLDKKVIVKFPLLNSEKSHLTSLISVNKNDAKAENRVDSINSFEKKSNHIALKSKNDEQMLNEIEKDLSVQMKTNDTNLGDEVTTKSSGLLATKKSSDKNQFNISTYFMKFSAFIGGLLLFLFIFLKFFKKGFVSRGKLGFLEKTEQLMILNTTHIGPKKSLILVKSGEQIFLVGATENSINLISELKSSGQMVKNMEREVAGDNFDDSFLAVEKADHLDEKILYDKIKMKEDITQSNQRSALSDYLQVKETIKFSDQIRKKVKSLKPLQ
jgi:flagellar biogenesis protein FliO